MRTRRRDMQEKKCKNYEERKETGSRCRNVIRRRVEEEETSMKKEKKRLYEAEKKRRE